MSVSIFHCSVTPLETGCYLITDDDTGKSAVVDPGEFGYELDMLLKARGVKNLEYILLTHGHYDHIGGVAELKKKYGGKIVISGEDEAAFRDRSISFPGFGYYDVDLPEKADLTVSDGDVIFLGNTGIKVMSTPGHTAGSVCYIAESSIFSGDTLFARSCGRTDFKTGSDGEMLSSLKKLASLTGNYAVYPGHGPETDLDTERRRNPFIQR